MSESLNYSLNWISVFEPKRLKAAITAMVKCIVAFCADIFFGKALNRPWLTSLKCNMLACVILLHCRAERNCELQGNHFVVYILGEDLYSRLIHSLIANYPTGIILFSLLIRWTKDAMWGKQRFTSDLIGQMKLILFLKFDFLMIRIQDFLFLEWNSFRHFLFSQCSG